MSKDDTTTTDDTTVSEDTTTEAVDTSTNEELQDTDVDLESDETSFEDEKDDDTEEADDSEDEDEDTEPAESEEESKEDDEQSESQEEESSEESEEDTTPDDVKKHNQEMAQRRIAEKRAREQELERQQQQFLEQAEDDKDLALRQLQIDAYNNKVERNAGKLENGIERAYSSIDLLQKDAPEAARDELLRRLDDFEARNVEYNDFGHPVNVRGDVYAFLQTEADSIKRILGEGAKTQAKAKTDQKSRTTALPSRAPKEPKTDPDLDEFDKEIARLM